MTWKKAELKRPRTGWSRCVVMGPACPGRARAVSRGNTALPRRWTSRGRVRRGVPGGDLGPGAEAQPRADPFDVRLGGALGDHQLLGDLAVRPAPGHQPRHLRLA